MLRFAAATQARKWLLLLGLLLVATAAMAGAATWPPPLAPAAERADAMHVHKAQRRLELLRAGKVIASYRIALGGAPVGHKRQQGDQRTPEGDYPQGVPSLG